MQGEQEGAIGPDSMTNSAQHYKILDVLQLLQTDPIIKEIWYDLTGYKMRTISGRDVLKRSTPPQFTDEFVYDLVKEVRYTSNIITSQTHIEKEEINLYLQYLFKSLNRYYHIVGRDHFITERTYQNILNIHRDGEYEKDTYISGWYKYLGRNWNTDSFITRHMVGIAREREELSDFPIRVQRLLLLQFGLVRASLYRSKDGLTLDHHQNIQKVSYQQEQPEKRSFINRLAGAGNRMRREQ